MSKPNPSAPRQVKTASKPAPPPKPFNEREQLAMAKALRSKRKQPAPPIESDDEE